MRYNLFISLFILVATSAVCQPGDFKFPTKFISFKHTSLAVGADFAFSVRGMDVISADFNDQAKVDTAYRAMFNGNLLFDLYTPNSLIGLQFGLGYKFRYFTLDDLNTNKSDFKLSYFSFPIYLKIRPGNHLKRSHFLMLIGASYNIPNRARVTYTDFSAGTSVNDNSILNSHFSAEITIGYEVSLGKKSITVGPNLTGDDMISYMLRNTDVARFYFYLKGGYTQSNTFIPSFKWAGYSPSTDWNFTNHYISIGLISYLRLTGYSERNL